MGRGSRKFLSGVMMALTLCACRTSTVTQVEHSDATMFSNVDPEVEFVPFDRTELLDGGPREATTKYVMKTEVSARDFKRFLLATKGYVESDSWANGRNESLVQNLPLTSVSRYEMIEYCKWIGGRLMSREEFRDLVDIVYDQRMLHMVSLALDPAEESILDQDTALKLLSRINFNGTVTRAGEPIDSRILDLRDLAILDGWIEAAPCGSYEKYYTDSAPLDLLGNAMEATYALKSSFKELEWSNCEFYGMGGAWNAPLVDVVDGYVRMLSAGHFYMGFRVLVEAAQLHVR